MNQTAWLVQRAVLAIVLVSFDALALGLAGALVWIPDEVMKVFRVG